MHINWGTEKPSADEIGLLLKLEYEFRSKMFQVFLFEGLDPNDDELEDLNFYFDLKKRKFVCSEKDLAKRNWISTINQKHGLSSYIDNMLLVDTEELILIEE